MRIPLSLRILSFFVITAAISRSSLGVPRGRVGEIECRKAYNRCLFRFDGNVNIPSYPLSKRKDEAISTRIRAKDEGVVVGQVQSDGFEATVFMEDGETPLSKLQMRPGFSFARTAIKSFPIRHSTGSGIGVQSLVWRQRVALRNKCARVSFSWYQILSPTGNVLQQITVRGKPSESACVVLWFK